MAAIVANSSRFVHFDEEFNGLRIPNYRGGSNRNGPFRNLGAVSRLTVHLYIVHSSRWVSAISKIR